MLNMLFNKMMQCFKNSFCKHCFIRPVLHCQPVGLLLCAALFNRLRAGSLMGLCKTQLWLY